jgi:hypothetical protein
VTPPTPPDRAVWHGSDRAFIELTRSIAQHCTCPRPGSGRPICGAHRLLLDQRALDGLLFVRRLLPRLRAEEQSWTVLRWRSAQGSSATRAPA